ncbi:MAG: DNRLRE domain-containing protein, partial [bacterium]|nr:DNRLRE domain-containing protein [bacterium]
MEAITNLIKLPEEYENYKINITKEGYQMYSKELTKEEIGNYSDDPLEIILLNNENNVIIIQPNGETGKDAYIEDYPNYNYNNRNFGSHPELAANAWTVNGIPAVVRGLIEFDLSVITDASLLENAQLYLYAADSTVNCPGHSQLSGSNEWKIQRVITSWDENVVTWNTQPEITTENQVILPASTHSMQDYQVDVTQLIKDIINNPSAGHGFMIRLVNENYYRRILFASSDNEYSSLHPKLVITLKGV